MYIELNRSFRALLCDKAQGDDPRALSPGGIRYTLPDLLNERRVVILAEAGSGKTWEIHEATRKLRKEGKAAFFLRLEQIGVEFDSAFEEGTLEEFEAWLASSLPGWVLLDSIDESRLRSPAAFEAAMRMVGRRLAQAKQRTHLLITGRAPAWRPRTDLDLCNGLFPIADSHVATPAPDGGETGIARKQADVAPDAGPFKIVTLEDLSDQQVRRYAEAKGVVDPQAFLDAIERSDAWSFTARPQDLDELTGLWLDKRLVGTRWDLMANSVARRLKEWDPDRADMSTMTPGKALEGVQIVAAALVLTKQQSIQVPDRGEVGQCLKLDALLPRWTPLEITTLLQRPLFAQDGYGTVRFHHRTVKEYLAAQWFLGLLHHEASRRKVEDLFFRQQYGMEVVVPSLRPLLPWLAMADAGILARVRRVAPEIVFEGGDPVRLPAQVRRSILEQVCDQIASGESRRSMADYAAIQRFAAPDLTSKLCALVRKFKDNEDIVFFLMRMIWQGRLADALPEAMDIARSPTAGYAPRIAAFRAIAAVGMPQDMESIRTGFAQECDALDRRCMADLVSHVRDPDEQTFRWLLGCIPRCAAPNEFDRTGLSKEIADFFARAPIRLVDSGLEQLHALLTSPALEERSPGGTSKRFQWLREASGVAVRRLIEAREAAALKPHSLAVLQVLGVDALYDSRAGGLKNLGLADGVRQWSELKWSLFWHAVEQDRGRKSQKGEHVVDALMVMITSPYVSFDGADFDAALRAIAERPLADDKQVALSLTFWLYLQTGRQRSRLAQLRQAAGGDGALTKRLAEMRMPPKKSEALKQQQREHARWSRLAAARSAQLEKARLEAPGKIEAHLDALRVPGFTDQSAISEMQNYLFHRMQELDGGKGSRWASRDWRALEPEFGPSTPRAFRDGMVHFWRGHSPKLVSEGKSLNSIPVADLFGLTGLTIEAAETPGLLDDMRPGEAAVAFRYAMCELNGFPPWFPALTHAHRDVVKTMTLKEITFELEGDQEEAPSHQLIADISRSGDWLWNLIAPDIVKLLRTHPPKSAARLLDLLDIVQASNLSDATLAALASEKMASVVDATCLPIWAATWTCVDPGPAIDAVEAHLASLGDAKARTEFTMSFVTHLVGSVTLPPRGRGGAAPSTRPRYCCGSTSSCTSTFGPARTLSASTRVSIRPA